MPSRPLEDKSPPASAAGSHAKGEPTVAHRSVRLSPSVAQAIAMAGPAPVPPWAVVKALLSLHPEYGHELATRTRDQQPPKFSGQQLTADEWVDKIRATLTSSVAEVHGRLVLVGLARLDAGVAECLSRFGFLAAVTSEIRESIDQLFRAEPATTPAVAEHLAFHADGPALQDALGRRGFAAALATRLRRIWHEHVRSGQDSSFVVHLHGPWGSGKSSLLRMLSDTLKSPAGTTPSAGSSREEVRAAGPWVVVSFNAWQQSRVDPPWWALLESVYRQSLSQLRTQAPVRAAVLWLRARSWRLVMLRGDIIAITAIAVLAVIAAYFVVRRYEPQILAALPHVKIGDVSDGIAVVSALLSVFVLAGRSMVSSSARAAQTFLQTAGDPMARVSSHFRAMARFVGRPVLVLVDDLDRCHSPYVVRLLEGIQTLFADGRVVYVIAADREWLYSSFEQGYHPFLHALRSPGRGLGSLFLEKVFQLSVSVPHLSPDLQRVFWEGLVLRPGASAGETFASIEREVRKEFADAQSESAVFAQLKARGADPLRQQMARQVAIERLADARVEASTTHFLAPFAHLVEPNPRAMKRLLNAYAVQRDLAILSGLVLENETLRKQLVLWTILCLRWPALERHFLEKAAGLAGHDRTPNPEIAQLLDSSPVTAVLAGAAIGAKLDDTAIEVLAGLRSAHGATSGSVA